MGVEEQTVRSWERGTRFSSPRFRDQLCEVFGMSPEQFGLQRSLGLLPTIDYSLNADADLSLHQHDKNLRSMRSIWIEGVLDCSLYHAALIVLGLQEQPDALENL